MNSLDIIKSQIKNLYETNPRVHINISISHPRIHLKNDPVKITGVYKNVFRIEENSSGIPKYHTLQYTDVLTKEIEIVELNRS